MNRFPGVTAIATLACIGISSAHAEGISTSLFALEARLTACKEALVKSDYCKGMIMGERVAQAREPNGWSGTAYGIGVAGTLGSGSNLLILENTGHDLDRAPEFLIERPTRPTPGLDFGRGSDGGSRGFLYRDVAPRIAN